MPDFKYRGVLRDGKTIRGIIPAQTKMDVINKLKTSKIQPVVVKRINNNKASKKNKEKEKEKIDKQNRRSASEIDRLHRKDNKEKKGMTFGELLKAEIHPFARVKQKDIISFMNNLYILKKAKFNNIQALKSLYEGTENPVFRDVIEDILIGVEQGERMHTIMANYPKYFSPMVVNFIKVGEESGTLDTALMYARDYVETSMMLTKKVKSAVIPKIIQIIGIIAIIIIAVLYGVPLLETTYAIFDSDAEIAGTTQVAVKVVYWILDNGIYILAIILLLVAAFEVYIHTPRGRYNFDKFKLRFPVLGHLITTLTVSNFFQAMLLNLRNGMRIKEALEISKGVSKNYYFLSIVEVAKNRSLVGESWIKPFEERQIFTPMVTEMLTIGMNTDLSEMMSKVNEYLQEEIDDAVQAFVKWVPEISYGILGIFLIILVLVVVVPLIDVYMGSFISF